jgi:ribosomal protein S25
MDTIPGRRKGSIEKRPVAFEVRSGREGQMQAGNIYTSPIKKKRWNNLWHCAEGKKWREIWNGSYGDESTTVTQVEYTICCYCWRKRLTENEIVKVVAAWWMKHGINGNFYQLRHYTIPKSFKFVRPYLDIIEEKYVERRRIEQANRRAKRKAEQVALGIRDERTTTRIVEIVQATGIVTAEQISTTLEISLAAARRQLARLAQKGILNRVGRGRYAIQVVSRG